MPAPGPHLRRFHAYHGAGVHRITCPSVPLLEQYMAGEGGMPKLAALEVHELLCTMVNSDEYAHFCRISSAVGNLPACQNCIRARWAAAARM
jgi:hypothetical protein